MTRDITISIVTICFNNLEDLKSTCASVDIQTMYPYEHWIINGSTTDDIKEWLENTQQPPYRKWINEPDRGIADAFNKGIHHSNGVIVYLLNSGDRIYDGSVLQKVTGVFETDTSLMWCHGKLQLFRGGNWVIIGKPFEKKKLYRGMRSVFHPTMYVKKEVYQRRGTYDINIRIAMDYDFLCRIADEQFTFINYPLAIFDPKGISSSRYRDAMNESFQCYKKYYGKSFKQVLWGLRLQFLHNLINTSVGKFLYKLKVKLKMENK